MRSALQTVKKILAADFACEEGDFDEEGVFVCQAREIEGARRFPLPDRFLAVVTMGRGVVVSCSPERLRWARTNLGRLVGSDLFSAPIIARMDRYVRRDGQFMAGPDLKYVCARDSFLPCATEQRMDLSIAKGAEIAGLYRENRFPNALGAETGRSAACNLFVVINHYRV